MRRALSLIALGACGRFGFSDRPVSSVNDGAPPDEPGFSLDATIPGDGVAAVSTCGTNALLQDGFDVAGAAPLFGTYTAGGLTLREQNSRFEVAFASNVSDGNYAGYKAVTGYAPAGLCGSVHVLSIPSSNGMAYMKLTSGTQQVELSTYGGYLSVRTHQNKQVASLVFFPFDPVAHAYWRIRQEGATTFWDVGSDGVAYTQVASAMFLTDATVKYELGGGSFGSSSNAGLAAFDDALLLGP